MFNYSTLATVQLRAIVLPELAHLGLPNDRALDAAAGLGAAQTPRRTRRSIRRFPRLRVSRVPAINPAIR